MVREPRLASMNRTSCSKLASFKEVLLSRTRMQPPHSLQRSPKFLGHNRDHCWLTSDEAVERSPKPSQHCSPAESGRHHVHVKKGTLSLEDWGQYLMRHSSGRFAHHARFRHYLFNRVQREKASHTGTVFHKHYSGDGVSTFDDLKVLLRGGERTISSRLGGWSQNLRGTAAWKKDRRGELRDMIATLGLPTLFVTLSAADLHWHFLHDAINQHLGASPAGSDGGSASSMQRVVEHPSHRSRLLRRAGQEAFLRPVRRCHRGLVVRLRVARTWE